MVLIFQGLVSYADRSENNFASDRVTIGGTDVLDELAEETFGKNTKAYLNGELVASGTLLTMLGWGYSEWTPMESDLLELGSVDLADLLMARLNETVELIVTDEE